MSYYEWERLAKEDSRLRPKYGNYEKTEEQKEADKKFVEDIMKMEKHKNDKRKASNHMIDLGFQYLYKGELRTAMYRFNQAYLLDNDNTDIYWGFGAVYMSLSNYEKAKEQYEEGLKLNPNSTHLLTDLGTYYMMKYYLLSETDNRQAKENLNEAIRNFSRSYNLNPKDQNTLFKVFVSHLMNDDCENARKFYEACKKEGGEPITNEYVAELNRRCK